MVFTNRHQYRVFLFFPVANHVAFIISRQIHDTGIVFLFEFDHPADSYIQKIVAVFLSKYLSGQLTRTMARANFFNAQFSEVGNNFFQTGLREPHKVAKLMRLPGGCLLWH